ncbi:hypothetical protein CEXT_702711 [Caerostris extrusa]|uniref:Uncharacterized protein n=1 Tax=Caerostris extrusa TaxID=172846 RepID=A0AAV4NLN3_CAEEX|nr:hypothetical protein CEXT_702711 [Caerostris extrusa]
MRLSRFCFITLEAGDKNTWITCYVNNVSRLYFSVKAAVVFVTRGCNVSRQRDSLVYVSSSGFEALQTGWLRKKRINCVIAPGSL